MKGTVPEKEEFSVAATFKKMISEKVYRAGARCSMMSRQFSPLREDLRSLFPHVDPAQFVSRAVKFGVAGYGGRGKLIGRKLTELGFSVLGVHDSDPARLVDAPFRTFSSLDDLLVLDLDALVISTWPAGHAVVAEKGLERGLDVFIEKPMGTSLHQSRRIVEAQEKAGRLVVVDYTERVNPAVLKLCEIADLTQVMRSREVRIGMFPPAKDGGRVGVTLDLASHGIDMVYHLFHARPTVKSAILTAKKADDPEHGCVIELECGKVLSCIEAQYSNIRRRRLELDTDQEYYEVNYTPAALKVGLAPPKLSKRPRSFSDLEQLSKNLEVPIDVRKVEPLNMMLLLFAGSVRQGTCIEPLCNAQEALVTAEVISEVEQVAKHRILE